MRDGSSVFDRSRRSEWMEDEMKVALIGASGKAGSRVLKELVDRGHEVTALVRNPDNVADLPGVSAVAVSGDGSDLADKIAGQDAVISSVRFVDLDPDVLLPAIKQLENFAGIMNFVIFPMFFLSSALYPLWKMRESSDLLYQICVLNPFTHAVELIRFALYGQLNASAAVIVIMAMVAFLGLAVYAYNPARGMVQRKGGPGG